MRYADRADAGRRLAGDLQHLRGTDVVVLGLPRGGVPVAAAVADALDAPLDVILVRKIGVPSRPELAMGAVGEGGVVVLNDDVLADAPLGGPELAELTRRARVEVERRARRLRRGRPPRALAGRTAVLVDDGIATGATARAACRVARALGAARVVLAAPVCAPEAAALLRGETDELVCPLRPRAFGSVGRWYEDFEQVGDRAVADLLRRARRGQDPAGTRTARPRSRPPWRSDSLRSASARS